METPKVQYSSEGWVRKLHAGRKAEKFLPEMVFVIC